MKRRLPTISGVFILCSFSAYQSCAQGCSDAGFCTIGNLSHQRADSISNDQKISLLLPFGVGDEDVFTPGIQYDNQLSNRWAIQAKVTTNYAEGNLGSASGLGDIFLSGTHTFLNKKKMESICNTWYEAAPEFGKH